MERLKKIRNKWPFFALITLYIYLAFHAFSGSQGLMRWVDYENDIERNKIKLEAVTARREALEAHADSLKASQLDLDMLDRKSREMLFVSRPNEKTIWLDPTP
ncbi:FtsB family cell division protein [Hellea balneolensis]|uniref:FtsB family cell division protein n=1 Tax=Hellea balneolensis TaxID=287478 RepID=UPI000418C2D6|nr:septum formation initiator family protein [Hellea balneolensis]